MTFEEIRPFISGAVGAIVTLGLMKLWSRFVPASYGYKDADRLWRENRWRIWIANTIAFSSILLGIAVYWLGYFPKNDWRGFGLGFGAMAFFPIAWLFISSIHLGLRRTKESFVAYSISQKTPSILLYGIIVLASGLGFAATISTIKNPPTANQPVDTTP